MLLFIDSSARGHINSLASFTHPLEWQDSQLALMTTSGTKGRREAADSLSIPDDDGAAAASIGAYEWEWEWEWEWELE